MKRTLVLLVMLFSLMALSCNRSTCPTFDENAGDKSLQGGGKTKSGVYPKNMKR